MRFPEGAPMPAITGVGSAVPPRIVTNLEIARNIIAAAPPGKTRTVRSMDRIFDRVGVKERHWVEPGRQTTSDLSSEALKKALAMAGVDAKSLKTISLATSTPDHLGTPVSARLQHIFGIVPVGVRTYDIASACNGFLQALYSGMQEMTSPLGHEGPSAIVGADILSLGIDPRVIETYLLLGDAAGAVILENIIPDKGAPTNFGSAFGAQGEFPENLAAPAGGSKNPLTKELLANGDYSLHMKGKYVEDNAIEYMSLMAQIAAERAGVPLEAFDLYIPHQANIEIINGVADKLNIRNREKVMITIDKLGNTSAASIPTALDIAIEEGRIKRNQLLLMLAFGSGLNYGSVATSMVGLPKR